MERFKSNNYASHTFSFVELVVVMLVIGLVVFIVTPNVLNIFSRIKINSVIDSANSYKESVNNYYVSQMIYDSSFRLDGYYEITDGNLAHNNDVYNILMVGNVPSDGYLDYDNNVLKDGCIVINSYSVIVEDGEVVSAIKGNCDSKTSVAYSM